MQLMSKFNKVIRFLLCDIDIFRKYSWVISLRDKNSITITNAFQKILDKSNCKPNEISVDKSVNFTINKSNHGYKIILQKCFQHIMKENLLKHLLES